MHALPTLAILLVAVQNAVAYNCDSPARGSCADGILHWYDPDDGRLCDPVDCGGGRAPPKTNEPCCPLVYKGTETCGTKYFQCFNRAPATSPVVVAPAPTPDAPAQVTTTFDLSFSAYVGSPIQTTVAAPVQTTPAQTTPAQVISTAQVTSAAVVTSVISTITTSPKSSAASSAISSRAQLSSGSPVSSAAAVNTNAAGSVQHDSIMALIGLAVGLVAAI